MAGTEGEVVLEVADKLCAELGCDDGETGLASGPSALCELGGAAPWGLSPEEESFVADLRKRLARLASAAGADGLQSRERAVKVALDGAELVVRGELVSSNGKQLTALMPSFVFLVTLPVVEQDEALELSRRAAELVKAELGR